MQAVQVRCGLGLGGARSMRRKRAFTLAHVAGQVASTCAMRAMLLDLQCAPFVWHKGTSGCSKLARAIALHRRPLSRSQLNHATNEPKDTIPRRHGGPRQPLQDGPEM